MRMIKSGRHGLNVQNWVLRKNEASSFLVNNLSPWTPLLTIEFAYDEKPCRLRMTKNAKTLASRQSEHHWFAIATVSNLTSGWIEPGPDLPDPDSTVEPPLVREKKRDMTYQERKNTVLTMLLSVISAGDPEIEKFTKWSSRARMHMVWIVLQLEKPGSMCSHATVI